MTYRFVSARWLRAIQLVTLVGSIVVGISVIITPPEHMQELAYVEQQNLHHVMACSLIIASVLALTLEAIMYARSNDRWVRGVSYCHIVCCGVMGGYTASEFVSVLTLLHWNFIPAVLSFIMVLWHALFTRHTKPLVGHGISS